MLEIQRRTGVKHMEKELLRIRSLMKHYPTDKTATSGEKKLLKAVDGVSLVIHSGETVGLVGESGCGKSTLGRLILKLTDLTAGKIYFEGQDITDLNVRAMRPLRSRMQIIFQDPFASLNPKKTIYDSVSAPLRVLPESGSDVLLDKTVRMLEYVGLGKQYLNKYPHEMSGGQRQRVAIARALVNEPSFVVCDEPVSALDVSVRAQVLNLMKDIQERNQLSYLFISHDLSVVRYLCDRVAVMYLGKIVEIGTKQELFSHPLHPYTKALLSAIPIPDVNVKVNKILLNGDIPSPTDPPTGCRFHTRCPFATDICATMEQTLREVGSSHLVACHRAEELSQ
ncbi:Oligopeptide transport ATP-binding protein OppF [bioreactor metagenome]|uniref:Oligopeptide transport ATP-binding protein OppF n=1 Tax=bioreactor metagenome TaxID=1076179 RepID=A0A645A3N2_9ZZZZ